MTTITYDYCIMMCSTILLILQLADTSRNSALAFSSFANHHVHHVREHVHSTRCATATATATATDRFVSVLKLKEVDDVDDDVNEPHYSEEVESSATITNTETINNFMKHEYTLEANSDPNINGLCRFTEEQIHVLIAKRLECKKRHNFDDADKVLKGLNLNGIYVQDKARKYRVDGQNHFGRQQRYVQRGGSYGISSEEDIVVIAELVEERARYKRLREYHKSDAITDALKAKYNVKVNDKKREWSVVVSNWDNNDNAYVPSPLAPPEDATHTMSDELKEVIQNRLRDRSIARTKKKYQKADEIRDELMEEYSILIDDRTKEWKVVVDNNDINNTYENDSFVKEAHLSQRSAFIRRGGEDDNDDDDDDVGNRNDVDVDNRNRNDYNDDDVNNENIGNDNNNNNNKISRSSSVDDALSLIFTDDADAKKTTTMPLPPPPVIEENEEEVVVATTSTSTSTPAAAAAAAAAAATEESTEESADQLSTLTVVALKDKLRTAGLPVSGKKAELIDRLLSNE